MGASPLSPAKKLNISGMTAVDSNEISRAWACSQSCGRAAGSIYVTAVLNALVNMSKMSSHDSSDAILGEDEELNSSPTYMNLYSAVYEARHDLARDVMDALSVSNDALRDYLGQIAEYMHDLGLKYGVLTTYNQTIFLRQGVHNMRWKLEFSPVIHNTDMFQLPSSVTL
ncbi:hypothetical protein N7461_003976 [Penicillium sp. DV-2018c]|nr:hypothetical protein N7461_003976 [Penicillium sp. DV-2018c]